VTAQPIDFEAPAPNGSGLHRTGSDGTPEVQRAPATTPAEIVQRWRQDGPLVRVATGIAPLDNLCRGGVPVPWRVIIVGAPAAGKTAIETVIADTLARGVADDGVCVGILAVDEEPEDLTVRLAQIAGFTIAQAEGRDPSVLDGMRSALAALRLRLYDATWTIDAAARDLAT
jgi:hypothetical protein